ncbi:MAG: DUF3822 family protein [Bacteroidales bacterium]|nr:DUF3822 family protein [Bacteroidales bacterium]
MNTFKLEHLTQTEGVIVTNESNLSICLRADGFIFSIIDKNYKLKAIGGFSVDLTGSIPQTMMNIKTCFSSIGIHIFNFNSIRAVCPTKRSVWVPYKLYDAQKNKDYLKTVNALYSSDTVIANTCEKLDAVNIFAYPLQQYSGVKIVMPKAKFVSPLQVLAEYAFDVSSFMQNTFILHKNANGCDYVIFKGNSFTLSNTFDYKTPDDLIYFILYTLEKLQINTAEVNLLITGEKYDQTELTLLKRYVKHVSYANCAENISVPTEFDGMDLQKYFLLLA